jgi:hypothetical protein
MTPRTLVTIILVAAAPCLALAQVNVQMSGTIDSIGGAKLTLRTPPPPPRRVTFGESANPAPPAVPPTLEVDLDDVPASQWAFLRAGDRIVVVGVPSADGRRVTAIRIIGGSGPPRQPEAP